MAFNNSVRRILENSARQTFFWNYFDLRSISHRRTSLGISLDLSVTQEWRCRSRMNAFNNIHEIYEPQKPIILIIKSQRSKYSGSK